MVAIGREALLVMLCVMGGWLFLNHDLLYLEPLVRRPSPSLAAYALSAFMIYLFIRSVSAVAFPSPMHLVVSQSGKCSECGRPLDAQHAALSVRGVPPGRDPVQPEAALRRAVRVAERGLPASVAPLPGLIPTLAKPTEAIPRVRKEPWRPSWMDAPPRLRS